EPCTAGDVRFTWEFITSGSTAGAWAEGSEPASTHYGRIEEVEVLGKHEVRLYFDGPKPDWFNCFRGSAGLILPEHIFRPVMDRVDYASPESREPTGTGPWRVTEFEDRGDHSEIQFEAIHRDGPNPPFASIGISTGGDAERAARRVLADDEADWADHLDVLGDDRLAELEQDSHGEIIQIPGLAVERLVFNFRDPTSRPDEGPFDFPPEPHPLLGDRRIREAIALAIPRERIATEAWRRYGEATRWLMPEPRRYRGPELPPENLERARQIMQEIGISGERLRIHIPGNTTGPRTRQLELISEALTEIGFEVESREIDASIFFSSDESNPDSYIRFEADLLIFAHGPSNPYPVDWLRRYRGDRLISPDRNIGGYSSSEYDHLHERIAVEPDPERQLQLWQEIMTILTEDIVEVPIVQRHTLAAVSSRLRDIEISPWATNPSWSLARMNLADPT
ncbi:MAG: ABC transporter substrate-binding protein, partial [Chloroflexota bacterium]